MLYLIAGGFYGDEGKGKIVGYLSRRENADLVVRAGGGPQAGHTVIRGLFVTQVPSGLVNPSSGLLIARGTVLSPEKVLAEIEKYHLQDRIGIDYGCTIIEPKHVEEERALVERIGSVGTGTGPARAARVLREAKLAKDSEVLRPYLTDVADEVNEAIGRNKKIVVEGVQGYGLSLMDYRYYPNVTSQDTTASQFAADVGIGPKAIDEIVIENGVVKYELVQYDYITPNGKAWDRRSFVKGLKTKNDELVQGVVLVQLTENRKIKFEVFPAKTASQVNGFTANAKYYTR